MRSILRLAVVLLMLATGLRLTLAFGPSARNARGLDQATTILATSRGALLPEAPLPGGPELVPDTIAVGDLLLKRPGAGPGLRVAVLHSDLSLKSFEILDLARTPRRVDKLESLARYAEDGAVIVITAQGSVRPASGETAAFDAALQGLGARVTPFRARSASWALVSTRNLGTWRAVAEAYSETESVSLSVTISNRPEARARRTPGELVYVQATGAQRLDLSAPGQAPGFKAEHVTLDRWARVGEVTRRAYRLRSGGRVAKGRAAGEHVGWDGVMLGLAPRLELQLAVSPNSVDGFDGAECQLLVDGEFADSIRLDARDAPGTASTWETWIPWTVDLAEYAERVVRLELRVLPLERADAGGAGAAGATRANWILLGEPTLHWEAVPLAGRSDADTPPLLAPEEQTTEDPDAPPPPANLAAHALNGRALPLESSDGAHSFLVGGHLYGSRANAKSIYPSPSITANLERVNTSGAAYFVAQGDIALDATPRHLETLRTRLVDRLEIPFWNAVGKHDVANRPHFLEGFPQPTVGFFSHGPILHLVLDSELDSGQISGQQLEFLLDALAGAQTLARVKCVAIHSHRLIWVDGRPDFDIVWNHVNAKRGYVHDGAFVRDVLPALREIAAVKPVVWFSGDVGIPTTLPLFFHREPDVDLRWVAVGMGNTADDALVQVHAAADGELEFEVMRMDGRPSKPLEHFGLEYWKKHFSSK